MTRRVLLLINSLEGGGAENVMARLAGDLAARNVETEIRLALLDDLPAAHTVSPLVDVTRLDGRGSYWRSIRAVNRLIRSWRPDIVLSFLTRANCAALLARRTTRFHCVISERVNTTSHLGTGIRGRVLRRIVAGLYPHADAVVAVSRGVRDDLVSGYRVPAARISVINNPFGIDTLQACAAAPASIPLPDDFFVSVGRLVPNKAGDVLLRAFAAHRNETRHLVMLGEGPERARLEDLTRALGLETRVHLPGFVDNPQAIVGRATAYLSASRSEGFPNALVEALAVGRPVAVTDCPSGPSEILGMADSVDRTGVRHAEAGLLVPVDDVAALTAAMDLLDDPDQREHYSHRASERVRGFSATSVFDQYASILGL